MTFKLVSSKLTTAFKVRKKGLNTENLINNLSTAEHPSSNLFQNYIESKKHAPQGFYLFLNTQAILAISIYIVAFSLLATFPGTLPLLCIRILLLFWGFFYNI